MPRSAWAAPSPVSTASACSRWADYVASCRPKTFFCSDPSSRRSTPSTSSIPGRCSAMTSPEPLDRADESSSSREAALLRLLSGSESDSDVALIDIPLTGARVITLRPRDARRLPSLLAGLAGERHLLVVQHADSAIALVRNLPRDADDDQARKTATRLAILAGRMQPDVHCGISAPLQTHADIASAARDAGDAAAVADERGRQWLCVDEIWAELVARRVREV